jgi:hypothetical protein
MYHHNTIRKYVSALLSKFNDFETKYTTSDGEVVDKKIPVVYDTREKSIILDSLTEDDIETGNYAIIPRGYLSFSALSKSEPRIANKMRKQQIVRHEDTVEFSYASVPYDFTFQLTFICRGMNQLSQIIEQVAPRFNPTLEIDIWDADNLSKPTRIPVRLLGMDMENPMGYSENSTNLMVLNCSFSVLGNLYPPIKETSRLKYIETDSHIVDISYNTSNTHFNQDLSDTFLNEIFNWD